MDVFENCHTINENIINGETVLARNQLIQVLDYLKNENLEKSSLINNLLRQTGLYPYIDYDSANWSDKFVLEAFKADVGIKEPVTLHREQSHLLKLLLEGRNVAISAPTSFGKSFVIDSYIAIKKPNTVVIIVPTIALTDETRRRLYKKFSNEYRIITTTDCELEEKNILIFPQERAINYLDKLKSIDILIIDEFYKASSKYDKERSPTLLKAIIKLGKISKQKYFLAPNIKNFEKNVFTEDMEFVEKLDFNTVYLKSHDYFKDIQGDEEKKTAKLLEILKSNSDKSLIYAASYSQIRKVSLIVLENFDLFESELVQEFSSWLEENYEFNWALPKLVKRGFGIHNGQLHRSLSQIQVKLFEEVKGIRGLISTSSLIEGVNTSAKNVILWKNRKGGRGNARLDSFTFKNIIGRGGRMFIHFIGNIYLLEEPPAEDDTQLTIDFPDTALTDIDEEKYRDELTAEQIDKIKTYKEEMDSIIGEKGSYDNISAESKMQSSDSSIIKKLAIDMGSKPMTWNGLNYLNSEDPSDWEYFIKKVTWLDPGKWGDGPYGEQHAKFLGFMKVLPMNWNHTIPEILKELEEYDLDIDSFFKLERIVTFKFASIMSDINALQKKMLKSGVDISPFVSKLSSAFLPPLVYTLEEYGIPRMVSRKIHNSGFINLERMDIPIHDIISEFNELGEEKLLSIDTLSKFDKYIVRYFYNGIQMNDDA